MTDTQLKQAAQLDISYFTLAYKECPTCGRSFDEMHPEENLYPHWTGSCVRLRSASEPGPEEGK